MRSLSGRLYSERNRLLAALPDDEYAELRPHFEVVSLETGEQICKPGKPITHAYFPQRAVLSVLTVMRNGEQVESVTIGYEGMCGLPLVLGSETSLSNVVAQVAETAVRIDAAAFRAALRRTTVFPRLMRRYVQVVLEATAQAVACNRLHALEQRCARWLLSTHDRVGRDTFPLTQKFLAAMLGVHRPAVTLVAGSLQKAGLIEYRRGIITVRDRAGLEAASCECHGVVEGFHAALLGEPALAAGPEGAGAKPRAGQ